MLYFSIALVICIALICFKGVHIELSHKNISEIREMYLPEDKKKHPMGFNTNYTKEDFEQEEEEVASMDDMVRAVQDVLGGIADGDE